MDSTQLQPLKQPNELTVLFPRVGKLSGVGRKLHVSLMRSAQIQLRALAAQAKDLKATEFFKAPLTEIIRPISRPTSNLIELTKSYVDQMQSTKVTWTAPEGTKEGVLWDQMVLVTQAKISLEDGRLWLYWGFPQDMVAVLSDPQADYTLTQPEELRELSTYAAVSLYIIASRYKNNPSHATCIRPTAWWIEALRGDSKRKSTKDSAEVKLPPWRKFKSEKVMPAIEEINRLSPIYVEIIEIKQGLAVKDVQFKVWKKSQFRAQPSTSRLHTQAAALGIPIEEITNHLKGGYSEDSLAVLLAQTAARKENARLAPLENSLAYFRGLIRDSEQPTIPSKASKKSRALKPKQRAESTPQVSLFDAAESGEIKPKISEAKTDELPPATPNDLVFEELSNSASTVIDEILEQVRADLAAKNLLTAVLAKRIQEKNWKAGILKAHAIEFFGRRTYGADWKSAISTKLNPISE